MQVIELSDHPSRMLQETERRRGAAQRQARAQFEAAHAQQLERISRAVAARDQARAQRRWWAWWRAALTLRRERRRVPLAPQETASGDDDRQEILKAGIAGERTVVSGLAQLFGDDWILFRGYRNRGGEIDHLLLGPAGLIAIEVKHRNATVHCDGDNWWFDKYDRYGNRVDGGPIRDRGGRSPSVQLNEPADQLQEFLWSCGQPIEIQRLVLFTHPRSRLGTCRNPTVRIATSTDEIPGLLRSQGPPLDPDRRLRLKDLIERDHRHHQARRPSRGPRARPVTRRNVR